MILLGEHSVVPGPDGEAALAVPLHGVSCEVEVTCGASPRFIAEGVPAVAPEGEGARLAGALAARGHSIIAVSS